MSETRLSAAARLLPAVLLAGLVVIAGGASLMRTMAGFQPVGLEVEAQEGSWLVTAATPSSELVPGDRILQIDGEGYGRIAELEEALRRRATSELLVLRDGGVTEISHSLPPLAIDWAYLVLALIGATYLAIGLYTLLRDRRRPARVFYLWCLVSALVYVLSARGPFDLAGKGLYLLEEVARILLAPLTLHLFAVFPMVSKRLRPAVPFFYLPAALLLLMQADLVFLDGRWLFGGRIAGAITMLDRLEVFHLAMFGLAAAAVLIWRLRRGDRQAEKHRQSTWVAVGMIGGYLPFALLYMVPFVLGAELPGPLAALAVTPLGLVPLTFAYAILRYKLWDIGVLVRNTASLSLTVLVGVIGFSLANLTINRMLPDETVLARNLLSFVSGLMIAGMMLPVRRGVSSSLERLQYGSRFSKRRALAKAGRELLEVRDLDRLCSTLVDSLEAGLDVRPANLLLLHGGDLVPLMHRAAPSSPIAVDTVPEELWRTDVSSLSGVELPGNEESPLQRLYASGYRYVFPMRLRSKRIGLLVAGYKNAEVPLSSDDEDLVRNLLNQATLAIENAELLNEVHRRLDEVVRLQRFSQRIFDASPAGIAVIDGDGVLLSANQAFAKVAGTTATAGQALSEVLPITPLPAPEEGIREVAFRDTEGGQHHLQISVAPLQAGGNDDRRVLLVQDISERVAMETALQEKDRLASLGMLAAGVAHEVNTPITGISSYAQMLLADTARNDPRHALLKKVEKQTFRAARIVNNLLELARDRPRERSKLRMASLVDECLDLLTERIQERDLTLHWQPPANRDEILVEGNDGELQQVLTNLVLNAMEAMAGQEGGNLTVSLSASRRWVWLAVEDDGPGVDPAELEKLFEPFFSTKQEIGGTGLGLAISYTIVRRHEGDLRVISHRGEGSRFVVELPRVHLGGELVSILIVDDEEVLQDVLTSLLRGEGFETRSARTGAEGLELLEREEIDLVLLDLMLPDTSGLELLKRIRADDPDQQTIVITAYSSIESAIDAMREGAFHYIPKPFKNEEVLLTVRKALEQRQLAAENRTLREQLRQVYAFDNIIGKSKPMRKVFELIKLAAPAKSNILVLGESGTGKELVAKAIHHHSRRVGGPFVTVNSGSMPPDLLESNLFGHVKGAFTGAVANKKGLFESASGGSIFFDEIGNIPLDTQGKLLRVIQEKEFMPLGGVDTRKADVRIIAATNADLTEGVQAGSFREDLFYRLNVITVDLPPLRKRNEDIPLLVQHFLRKYAHENEKLIERVSASAMELLLDYSWPGNVRELENVIERAVVLSTEEELGVDLLAPGVRQPGGLPTTSSVPLNGVSFNDAVGGYKRQLIIKALEATGGVQKAAARLLQLKPTTLHEMMKRLDISVDRIAS